MKTLVLDTLLPVHCLGCEQEGLFLCLDCQNKLQQVTHQECITCRKPSAMGLTHQSCQRSRTPEGLISVFDYHDPLLAQAVIWGKYKFLPDVYGTLAQLMIKYLKSTGYNFHDADNPTTTTPLICPIPLAKERIRWRGFNQSEIIARELSKEFGWPVVQLLKRTKNTKTQKDLSKTERQANIANSFAISDRSEIEARNIILVDDVVTTGSTLLEAAKIMTEANTNHIWCLTLARD